MSSEDLVYFEFSTTDLDSVRIPSKPGGEGAEFFLSPPPPKEKAKLVSALLSAVFHEYRESNHASHQKQ